MNTNSEKLLLKDEVFQVVGCAIEVLNHPGMVLLRSRTKMRWWWSFRCGEFHLSNGVILNFKHRKLEWERIAL